MARSFGEISVQALYQSSLGKIYVRDLLARAQQIYAMSPYKISIRGPLARYVSEIPAQALYKSTLGKISVRDLLARAQQISMQCLCTRSLQEVAARRSLRKLSIKDLLVKISAQDLLDYQNEHCGTTSAEKVARGISKFAPCHSESHPARTK